MYCVTHARTPSILEGHGEWDGHTPSLAELLATDFPMPTSMGMLHILGYTESPKFTPLASSRFAHDNEH